MGFNPIKAVTRVVTAPLDAVNAVTSVPGKLWNDFTGQSGIEAANAANLQLGREQMAFQREMSNTAHQREVADLRKAGLNPILSSGGSGASTPSGVAPTMEAKPATKDAILGLINIVMTAMKTQADIKKVNADTENTIADTRSKLLMPELVGKQIQKEGFSARGLEADLARKEVMNKLWSKLADYQSDIGGVSKEIGKRNIVGFDLPPFMLMRLLKMWLAAE